MSALFLRAKSLNDGLLQLVKLWLKEMCLLSGGELENYLYYAMFLL
jgi:hypothetical protein